MPLSVEAVEFPDGWAVHGAFPEPDVIDFIRQKAGSLPLIVADPPYGQILNVDWDRIGVGLTDYDDARFASWMVHWTKTCASLSLPGAALYVWGGIGRPPEEDKPPFRPFYHYLSRVERESPYRLSTHITWKKKRAYGIQWGYLFTREELAYLVLGDVRKPRRFEVPLLDRLRGYAGYDKEHPAKSDYLRRTNVWDDITEILRGKVHDAEKPAKLTEIPIQVHTVPGEWILDPFAGSGSAALAARNLGRKWIMVERDWQCFQLLVERMKVAPFPKQ